MLRIFLLVSIFASLTIGVRSQTDYIYGYLQQEIERSSLDTFIRSQMHSLEIPGISIALINDGEITYHLAKGVKNKLTNEKVDENTIFEAASLSKPVFSFFILKMMEKGVVDLDRPLYFYKPEVALSIDSRYKNVTARQVLSHNTGFPNWRWFSEIPDSINVVRGEFFMLQNPGDGFTYSGEAYQYLARVTAHNSFLNMNELAQVFQEEVGEPLKMTHSYFVWDDHLYLNKAYGHQGNKIQRAWGSGLPSHTSKIFNAAGGLHTEARSYAQFLIALINRKGLYKDTFEEYFKEHTDLPSDHPSAREDNIIAWCLGIAKSKTSNGYIYRHGGNNSDFQSEFVIDIDKKFGYVFFVNCDKGKEFKRALEGYLGIRD